MIFRGDGEGISCRLQSIRGGGYRQLTTNEGDH